MRVFLFTFCLLLSACSIKVFGGVESRSYYVLQDLNECSLGEPKKDVTLVVVDASSSRYISGQKIVYSPNPSQRGYYQFANWFEPPVKRLSFLLRKRLECQGYSIQGLESSDNPVAQYQLTTELVDLYHDTSSAPGYARIVLSAELLDLQTYKSIGKQTFEQKIEPEDYNAESEVDAFNQGLTKILSEVTVWVDGHI